MNDMSKAEAMKATREARDRAGESRGSSAAAIESAMRRYLSAEQYRELAEDVPPEERRMPIDRGE